MGLVIGGVLGRSLGRLGKQCRERWFSCLDPSIDRSSWSETEEIVLIRAQHRLGNKWAQIAKYLPGRTSNAIKNHWHSNLRKKIENKTIDLETVVNSTAPLVPLRRKHAPTQSGTSSDADERAVSSTAAASTSSSHRSASTARQPRRASSSSTPTKAAAKSAASTPAHAAASPSTTLRTPLRACRKQVQSYAEPADDVSPLSATSSDDDHNNNNDSNGSARRMARKRAASDVTPTPRKRAAVRPEQLTRMPPPDDARLAWPRTNTRTRRARAASGQSTTPTLLGTAPDDSDSDEWSDVERRAVKSSAVLSPPRESFATLVSFCQTLHATDSH
eukprot:CAMPEP_0168592196 /NCGR_PEP_ID=MMETSP0420-20121227/7577_1 /TAXON_ID=498008 /ORGANISM="Pessonella sp." /LENGTH=331 /DNA_ID=CAMNT_0008628115 /DNA_START=248 /DNA_END=1242 /DNA_ORIENTATION=-